MKATALWTQALTASLLSLLAAPAGAEIIDFSVALTGAEEVPPVFTTGTGDVSVQIDTVTREILVGGSFDLLMGSATTASLIGFASPGFNGNIELLALTVIPIDDTGTSGDVSASGTLTPEQVQGLLAQQTYIQIRSSAFPNGELRGQIVPAPATLLLPAGLACTGIASRRRR